VKPCLRLVLLILLLMLPVAGCHDRLLGHESALVVMNEAGCDLTISIDGWEAFTIQSGTTRSVDNVGSGRHVLEAKDHLGRLVERRYIVVAGGEDFSWTLTSCSVP
jgi:hypothetical protein